jgi:hypothetical protein
MSAVNTQPTYATSSGLTNTLASLASSATAGRSCLAIDNTTTRYMDGMLTIRVKTSSSSLANDKACYVYLYGSEDGTTFDGSSAESVGTDAAVTLESPTILQGPFVIPCNTVSVTYGLVIKSVAAAFGGNLPRKFGFVLRNYTGQNLDSTEGNHQKTFTGIIPQTA